MTCTLKKKRLTLFALFFVLASFSVSFAFWASAILGSQDTGSGTVTVGTWTQEYYILVTNDGAGDTVMLSEITDMTLNYRLAEDITLTGSFTPIGWNGSVVTPFTGIFDGNGYKVDGMSITPNGAYEYAGLFAENQGVINNVSLLNFTITHDRSTTGLAITINHYAGGIAGRNAGTIVNSYAEGSVAMTISMTTSTNNRPQSINAYAGGLAGINTSQISDSHAHVTVSTDISTTSTSNSSSGTPSSFVGGLVGSNSGTILNTYAEGNVSSVGFISRTRKNSVSTLTMYAGGLVGQNLTSGSVSYSFALGDVSVTDTSTRDTRNIYYGGLVGGLTGDGSFLSNYRSSSQTLTTSGGSNTVLNSEGTPTTDANFKSETWISSNLSWDVVDIWFVDDTVSYPILIENKYS